MNNYTECYTQLNKALDCIIRLDLEELDKHASKEMEELMQIMYRGILLLNLLKEEHDN